MDSRYVLVLGALALFHALPRADCRAVNISNTWILPQEGFPVFYRYFRDRISWYEADAVCQFHHANLVTVDTTAQYDAARAYLKELDIMSNVWIGLIKSNDEGDFTWTDYKPLTGEGYWGAAPGDGRAPLCAALDPAHDFRWAALSCGGPQVASFICELPVPAWAVSETGGCLVRSLPSLTVQYLPELAAVRLASDCGLDGTRSVTCKPNEEHKDILKELSCFILDDDFSDNTVTVGTEASVSSGSTSNHAGSWTSSPTVSSAGDYSSSTRLRRETPPASTPISVETTTAIVGSSKSAIMQKIMKPLESTPDTHTTHSPMTTTNQITTANKIESPTTTETVTKAPIIYSTSVPAIDKPQTTPNVVKHVVKERFKYVNPLIENTVDEVKTSIFTQATDHFIPPLVMAKSKLSTDMTLVSAESKHRSKLAMQHRNSHIETIPMKPTVVSASKLEPTTVTEKATTLKTIDIVEETTIAQTTVKPMELTTIKPVISTVTNKIDESKYKKPSKGKKYDRLKEEGKKYKDATTPTYNPTQETVHKIVQVTIASTISTNAPTVIDITTRLPETTSKIANATSVKINTEVLIDPNIAKLNKNAKHNNESEQIEQPTSNYTTDKAKMSAKIITETITKPIPIIDEQHNISSETESTELPVEHSPDPLPRPNRSRMLTHQPQHRSFYPYFFNRVLG